MLPRIGGQDLEAHQEGLRLINSLFWCFFRELEELERSAG